MIGMRSGMGQKYGADTADPGAVGVLVGKEKTKKRRRKVPKNIKGLKYKKRK